MGIRLGGIGKRKCAVVDADAIHLGATKIRSLYDSTDEPLPRAKQS